MHIIFLIFIINYSAFTNAKIVVEGSNNFKIKVTGNLIEAKNNSVYLSQLIQKIKKSSSTVTIKAITNDKSTWHKSGKKSRSHTKALDNKNRGAARDVATNSIIYINKNRITKTHKSYSSGTLIHELVHAADLANGKYHSSYPVREKRAVFFQNIWRRTHARKLRADYHNRFVTNEYQKAKKSGGVKRFVNYYFEHNDVP